MASRRERLLGLAIGGGVQAVGVVVLGAALGVGTGPTLLGGLGSFAGLFAAGLLWMSQGSPPADRLHKDHPVLVASCVSLFVIGLVPLMTWDAWR